MSKGAYVSKYYKSFAGTDTIAFLMFPGAKPVTLGSLTTISYSMFRNKVPVINIGRTNINGITRGSRIYAGTMVFTLINKHWVRELQQEVEYLKDLHTIKVDELPLFDVMIVAGNEYGSAVSMFIYGIDFTDEAQTISVEDLFTENVFKFVAREVSVFDNYIVTESDKKANYYLTDSKVLKNYYVTEAPIPTRENKNERTVKPLNRNLYYVSNGQKMMGEDVARVQQLLNLANPKNNLAITYKFDRKMDDAVRDFQITKGLIVNGVVDNNVYTKLLQYTREGSSREFLQVINKSGAYVYASPDTSANITQILPYLAQVEIFGSVTEKAEQFYKTENGYVSKYDVYNYLENKNAFTYDLLRYQDDNPQVRVLQQMLDQIYPNFDENTGVFGDKTEEYIRLFQRTHDLVETGEVDYYTWQELLNRTSDDDNHSRDAFRLRTNIVNSIEPGIYTIGENKIEKEIKIDDVTTRLTVVNEQQVKCSVISAYKDKSTKTDSVIRLIKNEETIALSDFEDMFTDDPEKRTPTDVYYFIYPYGDIPLKWHFKIKE